MSKKKWSNPKGKPKKKSKMTEYVVKEKGFTGHIFKAKNKTNAKKQYLKKYGYYGGSISVREYKKLR